MVPLDNKQISFRNTCGTDIENELNQSVGVHSPDKANPFQIPSIPNSNFQSINSQLHLSQPNTTQVLF